MNEQQRMDAIIRRTADSVRQLPMFRADDSSGLYANQLVRATFRELFRFQFPETKWINGGLIPINTSLNEGATEYSFIEMEHSGRAGIVADNATDIPNADITGRNNLRGIKTIAVGVTYSRQDIRSARMQGLFDISTEKAMAAREAHDRTLNDLIRSGDEDADLIGVVNQPGIIVANAVTGNWTQATDPDLIIADVTTAINAMITGSDSVEIPNTALFPVREWLIVSTLRTGTGDGTLTVLEYLKKAHPMIQRWDFETGMDTVGADGRGSLLVYRNDAMRMRAVMPMVMSALPPEQHGLTFQLNFETRYGGVMTPRPRSVLRLDGITPA